ncbi:tyrosine phosphatase family-domain-containing protein [Annulohypoxylon maeteangense]|uniref:tyrosine phosphatase family-domain-containing protein n=1 Tax=Annulohypoxylon maeteangense TaxID=1927788 RepID=UPI00200728E7|nr:tyrosine phosphatase family-domain-containing protein [Annulohypoxylon maeteangense]KAI0886072.1 tyrosine phosphatase family-domain-containing protein [Annulohypoxylon maeteangense]
MAEELPSPPFHTIPGLPNFRDIGGYPVSCSDMTSDSGLSQDGSNTRVVRRGLVYRSSEPSKVTEDGVSKLQSLGISKVFDLRSAAEIKYGFHGNDSGWKVKEWDGARREFVPVFLDQDFSPEALALRYKNYSSESAQGFVVAYSDILAAAASPSNDYQPFKTILEYLASSLPSSPAPCLIHCTAGKDRTGVICALILSLCGVIDEVVAHEYSLTNLGLKERHAELIAHLMNNPSLQNDPLSAQRMISSQKEAMLGTLAKIREIHGTVEKCVVNLGLLSAEGVKQLRSNLVNEANEGIVPWQNHAKLLL